jgi:hypothetical protein
MARGEAKGGLLGQPADAGSGALDADVARVGGGSFERISDSICFHTRGSHSISMCDFMKIRSHQGYASQWMGFAA